MKKILFVFIPLLIAFSWLSASRQYGIVKTGYSYIDTNIIKCIDTNAILYNEAGLPLRYYQYVKILNTGEYYVAMANKKRYLQKRYQKFADSAAVAKYTIYMLGKKSMPAPLWNRSLIKNIPPTIDTNLIIYDQDNNLLKFYQYFGMMFNNWVYLNWDKQGKYLWRFSDQLHLDHPVVPQTKSDTIKKLTEVLTQLLQADRVLVIKSARRVYLQRGAKTFLTFPCNLGANPVGDKQQDGDRRTPEGRYTLVSTSEKGKYGKSFQISYPDSAHIAAAKQKGVLPGGDVMIHGTSEARSKLKDWTNGCIAISNANMDTLFKYVTPGTPIEIRK